MFEQIFKYIGDFLAILTAIFIVLGFIAYKISDNIEKTKSESAYHSIPYDELSEEKIHEKLSEINEKNNKIEKRNELIVIVIFLVSCFIAFLILK